MRSGMDFAWAAEKVLAIRSEFGKSGLMIIRINGKDMKDAVLKTDQFEMRVLELTPDYMKVSIKDLHRESFSFVPRFIGIYYPEGRTVNGKDSGPTTVPADKEIEITIEFEAKIRVEMLVSFDLLYARRKLATVSIE